MFTVCLQYVYSICGLKDVVQFMLEHKVQAGKADSQVGLAHLY